MRRRDVDDMIFLGILLGVVFVVVVIGFPVAGLYAMFSADRRIHRGHKRPSKSVLVNAWRRHHG